MSASSSLTGPPAFDARLVAALACSLVAHAALLVGVALLIGLGTGGRARHFEGEPLRAQLVAQAAPAALPAPAAAEARPEPDFARVAPATLPLPLPLPLLRPAARPAPQAVEVGSVTIHADESATIDTDVERRLAEAHPAARRGLPDFEIAPQGRYPAAGLADLRQALLHVVVVVKEDGSVEPVHGGTDDPVFGEAVREALAGARARPLVVDGEPRALWAVLAFYFEGYASGESPRTLYERK